LAASELLKVKAYKENIACKDAIIGKERCQVGGKEGKRELPKKCQ